MMSYFYYHYQNIRTRNLFGSKLIWTGYASIFLVYRQFLINAQIYKVQQQLQLIIQNRQWAIGDMLLSSRSQHSNHNFLQAFNFCNLIYAQRLNNKIQSNGILNKLILSNFSKQTNKSTRSRKGFQVSNKNKSKAILNQHKQQQKSKQSEQCDTPKNIRTSKNPKKKSKKFQISKPAGQPPMSPPHPQFYNIKSLLNGNVCQSSPISSNNESNSKYGSNKFAQQDSQFTSARYLLMKDNLLSGKGKFDYKGLQANGANIWNNKSMGNFHVNDNEKDRQYYRSLSNSHTNNCSPISKGQKLKFRQNSPNNQNTIQNISSFHSTPPNQFNNKSNSMSMSMSNSISVNNGYSGSGSCSRYKHDGKYDGVQEVKCTNSNTIFTANKYQKQDIIDSMGFLRESQIKHHPTNNSLPKSKQDQQQKSKQKQNSVSKQKQKQKQKSVSNQKEVKKALANQNASTAKKQYIKQSTIKVKKIYKQIPILNSNFPQHQTHQPDTLIASERKQVKVQMRNDDQPKFVPIAIPIQIQDKQKLKQKQKQKKQVNYNDLYIKSLGNKYMEKILANYVPGTHQMEMQQKCEQNTNL